jgi:hypothetical protein
VPRLPVTKIAEQKPRNKKELEVKTKIPHRRTWKRAANLQRKTL